MILLLLSQDHTLTVASELLDRRYSPPLSKMTACTASSWPVNTVALPVSISYIFTIPSLEAQATTLEPGSKATLLMECGPRSIEVAMQAFRMSQRLSTPYASPDAINSPYTKQGVLMTCFTTPFFQFNFFYYLFTNITITFNMQLEIHFDFSQFWIKKYTEYPREYLYQLTCRLKVAWLTEWMCPKNVVSHNPVLASQRDTVLSADDVHKVFEYERKLILLTESPWPRRVVRHRRLNN